MLISLAISRPTYRNQEVELNCLLDLAIECLWPILREISEGSTESLLILLEGPYGGTLHSSISLPLLFCIYIEPLGEVLR